MQKRNEINQPDSKFMGQEIDPEDLAKLANYPSICELFVENNTSRLDNFCLALSSKHEDLERIIRYGKRDEAEQAKRAARAIEVTLEFLQTIQKMRLSKKN